MKFRGSAVAVALSTDKLKLDELNGKMKLCEMLNEAWYNGKSFCTSSEHHECNGSAYHTGLREMPEDMRSGEFLHKRVGLFESARAARRFFISNLKVEPGTVQKQLKKLLNGRVVGIVVTSVIMKISLMLM